MIIKADKSQDLQLASWDPGELMFQFEFEGREEPMSQLSSEARVPSLSGEGQTFCSIQDFN